MAGRYKAYEEFTSTEEVIIEDFPKHWDLTRIKFNSLVKARVGWHGLKSDDFTEEGPYLVTGSDFKGKFIQWDNCYHCDEERYHQDSYIQLQNGDLLLTKDGTIGKIALVSDLDYKATLNSGVFVIRPLKDGDFTTKYYYWLLLSRSFTDFVDFYKTGSTIAHLYQDTFVNFKYSLPPLAEQQKIANFLDHETAKIDILIAKQEKLIELLTEKRQAVISHAVTQGLNPKAPMKDSGVEWLGEVPEHWNKVVFKHFIKTRKGVAFSTTDFCDSGVRVVKASDIKQLTLRKSDIFLPENFVKKYPKAFLKHGDIVLSTVGSAAEVKNSAVGQIAMVPQELDSTLLNQNTVVFDSNESVISKKFFFFLLQTKAYRDHLDLHAHGTANQASLNVADMLDFRCVIPSIEEQKNIAEYLIDFIERIVKLEAKAIGAIALMKERKTALISAAVTDKIDVRNYEDEKAGN